MKVTIKIRDHQRKLPNYHLQRIFIPIKIVRWRWLQSSPVHYLEPTSPSLPCSLSSAQTALSGCEHGLPCPCKYSNPSPVPLAPTTSLYLHSEEHRQQRFPLSESFVESEKSNFFFVCFDGFHGGDSGKIQINVDWIVELPTDHH